MPKDTSIRPQISDSNLVAQPDAKQTLNQTFLNQRTLMVDPNNPNITDSDILPELMTQLLQEGHRVRFQAPGKSMRPAVLDGDILIIEPIEPAVIKIGDIILYQAEERMIAHRVKSIEKIEYRGHNPAKPGAGAALTPSSPVDKPDDRPATGKLYAFILRGDASYSYDEPVYADQILGRAVTIERNNRTINPYALSYRLTCRARIWAARLKRIFS